MSLRSFALLGLAASALAEPKVLYMPMTRNPNANPLAKRDAASVTVTNAMNEGIYFVNATVGTPGQLVQLVLDTGSSDVWFFGPNSCNAQTSDCLGGIYDPSKSSTVQLFEPTGGFFIQYGTPNSSVTGNYILDNFSVGEASVKNLTMAYATNAQYVPTGIMGIGFDTNEAITGEGGQPYPNFVDILKSQNVISTRAYSLWLNDLDSKTGNCLFGGYDTKKFSGNLLTVPIQPDESSRQLTSMTVAWTSLGITTKSGSQTITAASFKSPALLDSGTTVSIVPMDIYQLLLKFFDATVDEAGDAIVQCALLDEAGSLDFTFGGPNGPTIKVPFSQFALPAMNTNGGQAKFNDGSLACFLGLEGTQGDMPVILGDTFLRSAYVVYDLDNKQISLAQTVFNATDSNIVEITSASPIASVVSGATVTQTATGNPNQYGGPTATAAPTGSRGGSGGSGGSDVTTSSITVSLDPVAQTGSASSSSSASSGQKSLANPAPVPDFMSTALIAGASMLLGGVFFALH
ncbi:hypothetical protein TMatcc_008621 [Talaromyces marneffei ATCC 18224]|uniref:Yapsin, putative n=3 Tax=Talaromyces marneffei TaxID=37727 RepID=B6QLH9_TALMQ|nr:uncharacterized protein EYB26_007949 [Talaromyces marneffei]EEA21956.1 yapsin, putative [Talaromyces marneffei ATCC 18224]KAE8550578.1 hypothetical protein EYB25_006806 [Talaromyces marneffei]QGA20247.1 hypothetical protein EYB26_007949 [Talaromyces marneffei]